ncbi:MULTISPECIES: GTP pyrophosphokinase [unclassified Saccharicrinis]|uniref:GTP pyrophosphokinase n=1 Tax=unclassified Saccharicrinis TaxID=2646859 RepID=UPI003D354F62
MNVLEDKIIEFKEQYEAKNEYYQSALKFLIDQIGSIEGVESVSGRVKDYQECITKFERKYLPNISSDNTTYKILDYLSDFIGIRVICYYLEDVDKIRKGLHKIFHEVDITDKTLLLERTEDKFGYKSLHLDLKLKKNGSRVSDKGKYYKIQFELQIRTIIQDAWSILDHKIKYKKSIPHSLKRRINRLSALFEIADDEFLHIKEEIALEENRINQRIQQGADVEINKPLDVFSFLFIALKYFPDYKFVEFKVDGFVQELLGVYKYMTESELNDALVKYLSKTDLIAEKEKRGLNPYNIIRYCLYLSNVKLFHHILSDYQKQIVHNLDV